MSHQYGLVGLGRMGRDLALQGLERGHRVTGYNRSPEKTRALVEDGLDPAFSYEELARKLPRPRVILSYVPHGDATDDVVSDLSGLLDPGDIIVDGGNSHWHDSMRRHRELQEHGIGFVDAGTSGGVEGARRGACFMVGGERDVVAQVEPIFRDLAVPQGYLHVGPPGSGHFVKLIHNAIEFGMVQAIAEGVDLLERSDYEIPLADLFRCWAHGSVIRSWLVELMEKGLREHPDLSRLSPIVEDTKEGKWYVQYALAQEAFVPILALSEMMFYRYRDRDSAAAKAVALMRQGYGGHPLHLRGETAADDGARR